MNFDDLHDWIGISRGLYDEVMAWHHEAASLRTKPSAAWQRHHFDRKQELLRRLALEAHPGIAIEAPRSEPRTVVHLSRVNVDAASGDLVLWDGGAITTDEPRTLPATPEGLTSRVLAWVAEAAEYDEATPGTDALIHAWEDEGFAIARELQLALGDDYEVVAR